MKSSERHKLKENEVASVLSRVLHWVTPRLNTILIVAGVLIVLLVAVLIIRFQNERRDTAAGTNITKTLQDLGGGSLDQVPRDKIPLLEEMGKKYKNTPSGAVLLYRLGLMYRDQNEDDKALEFFNMAVRSLEDKDPAYIAQAGLNMKAGRYDAAKEDLYRISRESPLYDNALYLLYLCGRGTQDESLTQKAAEELSSERFSESPYQKMIAIREVL
jgi:tetratricopeptide (TPR) repeat protein